MKKPELFGTDGIRGRAGDPPLDPPTISSIGYALVRLLGDGATVVVGRDTRESGDWIERALRDGIDRAGGTSVAVGVITTPGVAYLTQKMGGDAGVVISASHNPYHDNGIKVFSPSGQKLSDGMEAAIAEFLSVGEPASGHASAQTFSSGALPDKGLHSADQSHTRAYVDYLVARLTAAAGSARADRAFFSDLKIVIDCANGAAAAIAPAVFSALGSGLTVINAAPDGKNINDRCGALYPDALQQRVIEESADVGFAFDGDADRLVLVDRRGRRHDGDSILFLMSRHLHRQRQLTGNRVVATIMSNFGLELALRDLGIDLVRTPVGDKYVLEELLQRGGAIGGEQSGHIIFPGIGLAGDGIVTAIEVLRVMAETDTDLVDLTRDLVHTPQVLINLPVVKKLPLDTIAPLQEALRSIEAELASNGRVLVRYSGTENIVRIMIEGTSEEMIRDRAERLSQLLSTHLNRCD